MPGTDLGADTAAMRQWYERRARFLVSVVWVFDHAVLARSDANEPGMFVLHLWFGEVQMTFHINPAHVGMFRKVGVPHVPANDPRARWDHADKQETLDRVAAVVHAICSKPGEQIPRRSA